MVKDKANIQQSLADLKRDLEDKRDIAERNLESMNFNLFHSEGEQLQTIDDKCQLAH